MDMGSTKDIHDCIEKCCDHSSCEVAYLLNGKCYAVDCYTKELCKSDPVETGKRFKATLIYMNKRNHMRQKDKGLCAECFIVNTCIIIAYGKIPVSRSLPHQPDLLIRKVENNSQLGVGGNE